MRQYTTENAIKKALIAEDERREENRIRMEKVTGWSMTVACICCLIFGGKHHMWWLDLDQYNTEYYHARIFRGLHSPNRGCYFAGEGIERGSCPESAESVGLAQEIWASTKKEGQEEKEMSLGVYLMSYNSYLECPCALLGKSES